MPRLEATVESLSEVTELTAEFIMENICQADESLNEIARKIIKYQAKERAI